MNINQEKQGLVSQEERDTLSFYLEYEFENYAWGHSHKGLFIDSMGHVIKYDLMDSESAWTPSTSEYFSETEIQAKIHHADTLMGKLPLDTLNMLKALVFDTGTILFSDTICDCVDFGSKRYFKYQFQEDRMKFKKIQLGFSGDCNATTKPESAKKLILMIESILYRYDPSSNRGQACGPLYYESK